MAKRNRRGRRRWITITLIIVALLGGAAVWSSFANKNKAVMVETAESETRTIYARVTESGMIQPTIEVPIAPDVSGEVVTLTVKEGMKVKKGDLLVTIRPDEYQARLEQALASLNQIQASQMQAEASLTQAKVNLLQDSINFARNKGLFDDAVISQQEFETSQLNYNVSKSQLEASRQSVQAAYYQVKNAEATLKQAKQNLDRTNIYASLDGTVTLLNVELGQRVVGTTTMAGTEILRIADLSSMEVVVEINENDIVNLNLGDSSRIEVDAFPDNVFYGEVTEIAYSAVQSQAGSSDQVTNFEVKVRISPSSYEEVQTLKDIPIVKTSPFRPGMTSLVEIYTQTVNDAIAVPIQSVTLSRKQGKGGFGQGNQEGENEEGNRGRGGNQQEQKKADPNEKAQEVVFIVEADTVREVEIETGISDDSFIEIRSGLASGVKLVTGPYSVLSKSLKEGTKVQANTPKFKSE